MYESDHLVDVCDARDGFAFEEVINQISRMPWEKISNHDVLKIAKAYYYFSVQFRENLAISCLLYPRDENLRKLYKEECHTDNLSPYPGITAIGEKINHDEFIERLLLFQPIQQEYRLEEAGAYICEKSAKWTTLFGHKALRVMSQHSPDSRPIERNLPFR